MKRSYAWLAMGGLCLLLFGCTTDQSAPQSDLTSSFPDLTGGSVPDLAGGGTPDLTGGSVPDLTGGSVPDLTGGSVPDLTGSGGSDLNCGSLMECNSTCVDTTSDNDHCGGCNMPCQVPQTASNMNAFCATTCTRVCVGFFDDCDSDLASPTSNGCETNIRSVDHCGACNAACGTRQNAMSSCFGTSVAMCTYSCDGTYNDCNFDLFDSQGDGCETFGSCVTAPRGPAALRSGARRRAPRSPLK